MRGIEFANKSSSPGVLDIGNCCIVVDGASVGDLVLCAGVGFDEVGCKVVSNT